MSNPSTKRFVVLVTLIIVVLMIDEYFNVEVLNLTKNSSVYRTNVTKLHLLHVLSPFVAPSVPTEFYPLDINQWVAMESIRRALLTIHLSPEIFQVDLICAVFQSDLEALSKANLPCHRFVVLKRSTRTQYPQLKIDMDLPFVADMIEAATTKFKDPNSSFHVMITNADIGLSKYFYKTLHSLLQKVDAVSINRVTIPMENITATRNATDILENQIDTLISQGSKHPGFDLFCINSSVLTRVSFGDFFLGRPPWGSSIHLMLKIMADNYTNIESTPQGTFHMGNDRSRWKSKTRRDVGKGNDNDNDIMIRFCPSHPRIGSDALSVQNVINCGQWFLGNYSNSTLPLNQTSLFIPGFVRPGYEELYRLRYSNHLTYDTEGFPQRTEFQTPTKKTKAEGVLTRLNAAQEKRRKHAKAKRRRQLSVFKR